MAEAARRLVRLIRFLRKQIFERPSKTLPPERSAADNSRYGHRPKRVTVQLTESRLPHVYGARRHLKTRSPRRNPAESGTRNWLETCGWTSKGAQHPRNRSFLSTSGSQIRLRRLRPPVEGQGAHPTRQPSAHRTPCQCCAASFGARSAGHPTRRRACTRSRDRCLGAAYRACRTWFASEIKHP